MKFLYDLLFTNYNRYHFDGLVFNFIDDCLNENLFHRKFKNGSIGQKINIRNTYFFLERFERSTIIFNKWILIMRESRQLLRLQLHSPLKFMHIVF